MARKPNLKTPLGVIRAALRLDATQFGELVGCSKSTIDHIGNGSRPLKAELADKIHLATGVPRDWLDREELDPQLMKDWLTRGSRAVGQSTFKARSILENNTAGGLFLGDGWAMFPTSRLLPRVQAVFYACAMRGINPHLVLLGIERALSDIVSQFNLDVAAVDQGQRRIHCHYFGTVEKIAACRTADEANPAFLEMKKRAEQLTKRLIGADRAGGPEAFKAAEDAIRSDALNSIKKGRGGAQRLNARKR